MDEYYDILLKNGYQDIIIDMMYRDKKTPKELLDTLQSEYNYWLREPAGAYEKGKVVRNYTIIGKVVEEIKIKIRTNKINNILNEEK